MAGRGRCPEADEADASCEADGSQSEGCKMALRYRVWDALEAADAVLFPRPCHHRIPNCRGLPQACGRLLQLPEFRDAAVVKVHPSIGASALRSALVMLGKTVLVPPYPGSEILYLRLHSSLVPDSCSMVCSGDKREYLRWAQPLQLHEIPAVDVVVVAACVVAPSGVRLGKGKGYGEVEWGILTDIGAVSADTTPVFSLCHDLQVVGPDELPPAHMSEHDLPLDAYATPTAVVRCSPRIRKPSGVCWELVGPELEQEIGALRRLRSLGGSAAQLCRRAPTAPQEMAAVACVSDSDWDHCVDTAVNHFMCEEMQQDCQQREVPSAAPRWSRGGGMQRRREGRGKGRGRGRGGYSP